MSGLAALAKVGLRALIDEATGYQDVRANDDLRRYSEELGFDIGVLIAARIAETLDSAAPQDKA